MLSLLALLLLVASPAQEALERCGFPDRALAAAGRALPPSDCGYWSTTIQAGYDPTFDFDIPVVVHVVQNTSGTGYLSAAQIQSQIDVLNEDFQALPGTAGAPGTNARIRFHLATTDPSGAPTSGITYTTNDSWYQDQGAYWVSLAWDTNRYMNVYTNSGGGYWGYVPDWPQGGIVGQSLDRVVVSWTAFGRPAWYGPPFDLGRTLTHEVGHYFGIEHPFYGGCGSVASCYSTGDLICDTNAQSSSTSGCPGSKSSCSTPDELHNYMDYSDDACMWEFTVEQINRMRCTIEHWRPNLPTAPPLSIASLSPASVSALTVGTAPLVTLTGSGFTPATTVDVGGAPAAATYVDASTLTFDPPLAPALGGVTVTVAEGGASAQTTLTYLANVPPAIQAGAGDEPVAASLSAPLVVVGAGLPGDVFLVLASPDSLPTTALPYFSVAIGNGFASLFLLATGVVDAAGSATFAFPFALPPATTFYVEGLTLDGALSLPLADTNTQQVVVVP